ncbi:MAG: hypothetical protein ACT4NL_09900 [Pseudomarimonas sp.]
MNDSADANSQARLPWQTPTVESHGSLAQMTKSVNNAGNGDGLYSDANS